MIRYCFPAIEATLRGFVRTCGLRVSEALLLLPQLLTVLPSFSVFCSRVMDVYDRMVWEIWMPHVRRAASYVFQADALCCVRVRCGPFRIILARSSALRPIS